MVFLSFRYKKLKQAVMIAPRGLITLLLFYSIPDEMKNDEFRSGILLFVIIITSLVMTSSLIKNKSQEGVADVKEVE